MTWRYHWCPASTYRRANANIIITPIKKEPFLILSFSPVPYSHGTLSVWHLLLNKQIKALPRRVQLNRSGFDREGLFNNLNFLVNLAPTDLVKGIHLHCESVYTWHRRQGLEIRKVRCKLGFKWNIMEVVIADVRLLPVLCDTLFTIITQPSGILNPVIYYLYWIWAENVPRRTPVLLLLKYWWRVCLDQRSLLEEALRQLTSPFRIVGQIQFFNQPRCMKLIKRFLEHWRHLSKIYFKKSYKPQILYLKFFLKMDECTLFLTY